MGGSVEKPAPRKKSFADLAKELSDEFPRKSEIVPMVRASDMEYYASRMAAYGYDMTETSLKILCEYLKGYNIWICGSVGVGKTFFFDCMSRVRRSMDLAPIVKLSMVETQGWTMESAVEWTIDNIYRDVLLDDVGAEPMMNNYGDKIEIFPYLLEKRMQSSSRTHLTSNLGPADILKRYDRRVADRFAQMFKMMEIKSRKSRRTLSPWKCRDDGGVAL